MNEIYEFLCLFDGVDMLMHDVWPFLGFLLSHAKPLRGLVCFCKFFFDIYYSGPIYKYSSLLLLFNPLYNILKVFYPLDH